MSIVKTEAQIRDVIEKYKALPHLSKRAAAKEIGIPYSTLCYTLKHLAPKNGIATGAQEEAEPRKTIIVQPIPSDDLPVEEIISFQERSFEQLKRYKEASRQIKIAITVPGPIGLWWFGDPHLDDKGCDIGAAFAHAKMTADHEYVFGCCIGDTTNNWIGSLAKLYSQQNMSKKRALRVQEHFLRTAKWLYVIDGNHDLWSGDDSPIAAILADLGVLHRSSGCRVRLELPNGDPVTINSRHEHKGNSMYNTAHGATKEARHGARDHIVINGHKHSSGYMPTKNPENGEVSHAIQVASYKVYDSYADQEGFKDHAFSPGCMTVIDPELPATNPDRIKVFWDAEQGLDYLQYLRKSRGYEV